MPSETEPDADTSSSHSEHEEDGGHSDLEVTPPSSPVQTLQGSVTSVMTRSRYKEAAHKRVLWEANLVQINVNQDWEDHRQQVWLGYKDIDRSREVPEGEVQLPGG